MSFRRNAAVFVLFAASCFAASPDGKWTGNLNSPNGPIPVSFDLKSNGADVTGTTVGPQGEVKITNGKMAGDVLTFSLSFNVAGTNITMNYKGIVADDHINFTLMMMGNPAEFVVKRVS
jgi:hypothetical protein